MRVPVIILLSVFTLTSFAQDSTESKGRKWEFGGYVKNLETLNFDGDFNNPVSGNIIHNRLNIKWKPGAKFTAVAEFRNRLFWGDEVRQTPGYGSLLRNEYDYVNLQKAWINKDGFVAHVNTERLYVDYRNARWGLRVGRQRINWGISTTWNPSDIFNTYNFLDFDYAERPGLDAAVFDYTAGKETKVSLAYAITGKQAKSIAALKYSFNTNGYDIQLDAGWYKYRPVTGGGWAGNIKDMGFKGELQYFLPLKDSAGRFNGVVELDYMFRNGWYLDAGCLFNSRGISKPVGKWDDLQLKISPENLMPTKWNFILSSAKEINPLLSTSVSILYAPGTNLALLIPSISYNLSRDIDIYLLSQSLFLENNSRFQAINHRVFLRLMWSF